MIFSKPNKTWSSHFRLSLWLSLASALAIGIVIIGVWKFRDGSLGSHNLRVGPGSGADIERPGQGVVSTIPVQASNDSDSSGDVDAALLTALEQLEWRIAAAMSRARQSVVALEYTAADAPPGTRRMASGVVINDRGELLSVRIDAPSISASSAGKGRKPAAIVARDFSGRRHLVQWVAADPETGLTLLRLAPRAVRPIRMATTEPKLGCQVFVVGNPFGMGHSVSRGHVAGLDRTIELSARQLGGLLQVQSPLYPGDSGAAVVNRRGDWLGLIRSGLAIPSSRSGAGSEPGSTSPSFSFVVDGMPGRLECENDFGFALPARDVLWVAEQLRTSGRVDRAYLGVRLAPGSADEPRARIGSETETNFTSQSIDPVEGATLDEVLAGTPAASAGLLPGDTIVSLEGRPIRSTHDLTNKLDRILARTTILLTVLRGLGPSQHRISLSVHTASRPDPSRLASHTPASISLTQRSTMPVAVTATLTVPKASTTAVSSVIPTPTIVAGPPSRPSQVAFTSHASKPMLPKREVSPPQVRTEAIQANELRLTLPRAVAERLEQLERRLEKLEASTARASGSTAADTREIGSARKP